MTRVTVIKKAYYEGQRLAEGTVIEFPDDEELPSWAVPEGEEPNAPGRMRVPGKHNAVRSMREMSDRKESVAAKANIHKPSAKEQAKKDARDAAQAKAAGRARLNQPSEAQTIPGEGKVPATQGGKGGLPGEGSEEADLLS